MQPLPRRSAPEAPRVTCCFGTRPEVIKLFPVVRALRAGGGDVRLVNSGQHRALLELCLDLLDTPPEVDLDLFRAGQDLSTLAARISTLR